MDSPSLSQFVAGAADIGASGRWAALNEKIVEMAKEPVPANAWRVQVFAALCYRVFDEYLRLEDAHRADRLDPPLLAWRARNLLELSIWCGYFAKSRENARRLYEDAGRDAAELLSHFENWGRASGQSGDWLPALAVARSDLADRASSAGIAAIGGGYLHVDAAAKECGLKEPFQLLNKLLSKFAHPTAMQILGIADQEKQTLQRDTFFGLGCLFFTGAFDAMERCAGFVGAPEPEPLSNHVNPPPGASG